ncbi:spore cortex biosynthesis protein YabQ [Paenibacillus catalpae]|uniref:Spore cortex biosynthesis protein YabQ n=1 Tax=Paenibacillus catalpae TaxID=1045775 RepID=A0A1I2HQF9_9BACL|nr:spore cortex biosynthesis protein YabQ [Paenibacillus catalpae]SFF31653.1 spore cortex biosynthesis protein YabQ [Paenibacillus catalpae]
MTSLNLQFFTMGMMLLSGIGLGVIFDGYRVVSNELRFPRWSLPVLDMVYWLAASLLVFRVLYASNYGEVRAYVFLGLLIGVLSYYWLLSKPVIGIVKWLIDAVRALIQFTLRTFDLLIVKPVLLLYRLIRVLIGFGTALTIFLLKIVLQLVRPFWLLLRFLLGPLIRPLWRWLEPRLSSLQLKERWDKIRSGVIKLWKRLF